mmetsp:Transcript_11002/g.32519  ORF Transcript_11002/g.32519 Transcript_11002/m.32519 type:complete len:203 (-) Transcript_11002:2773-3381(-)
MAPWMRDSKNDDFMVNFAFEWRCIRRHASGPLVTVEFIDCPGNSGGRSGRAGRRFRGSVIFDEGLNAFSSSELSANFLTPTLCETWNCEIPSFVASRSTTALDVIILSLDLASLPSTVFGLMLFPTTSRLLSSHMAACVFWGRGLDCSLPARNFLPFESLSSRRRRFSLSKLCSCSMEITSFDVAKSLRLSALNPACCRWML